MRTPHLPVPLRRVLTAAPAALIASAALAGTAQAYSETLTITQADPAVTAGNAAHFDFSGTLDANDTQYPFQLYVFLKDPAVDPTCGADYAAESARAQQNGGANEAAPMGGVSLGTSGSFDRVLTETYWKAGAFLICGYVNNDYFDTNYMAASDTVAKAQFQGTAAAGGSGGSGGSSGRGETVKLTQTDPAATVGVATNLNASGTLDANDTTFNFDLHAFAKDPAWDSTCGATLEQEEATIQTAHGNEVWLDSGNGWGLGKGPTFSYDFKVTAWKPGPLLICAYVNNDFSTVATDHLTLNVRDEGGQPGAPSALKQPSIKRHGSTLTCRAGTWSGSPTSQRFRWRIKGKKAIVGRKRKLRIKKAWRGRSIVCTVSETNAAGTGTASTHSYKVSRGKR